MEFIKEKQNARARARDADPVTKKFYSKNQYLMITV